MDPKDKLEFPEETLDTLAGKVKSLLAADKDSIAEQIKAAIDERLKSFPNKMFDGLTRGGDGLGEEAEKTARMAPAIKFCSDMASGNIKDLGEGSASAGGYLVPEIWLAEVIRIAIVYGVCQARCRIIPMTTDTTNIAKSATGVTSYWKGESTAYTESDTTFGQLILAVKDLTGLTSYSNQLLMDANVRIVEYLMLLFGEDFAKKIDQAVILGDGTSTYGGITGIKGATSVVTITMGGPSYADDADADDLLDMQSGLRQGADTAQAVYLMRKAVLNSFRKIRDNDGRYIVAQPAGAKVSQLWNAEVVMTEAMSATDAADTTFVVYGDMKNAIIGDRAEMRMLLSDHATLPSSGSVYTQNLQAMRLTTRIAAGVPNGDAFAILNTSA